MLFDFLVIRTPSMAEDLFRLRMHQVADALFAEHTREIILLYEDNLKIRQELSRVANLMEEFLKREENLKSRLKMLTDVHESFGKGLQTKVQQIVAQGEKLDGSARQHHSDTVATIRNTSNELERIAQILAVPPTPPPGVDLVQLQAPAPQAQVQAVPQMPVYSVGTVQLPMNAQTPPPPYSVSPRRFYMQQTPPAIPSGVGQMTPLAATRDMFSSPVQQQRVDRSSMESQSQSMLSVTLSPPQLRGGVTPPPPPPRSMQAIPGASLLPQMQAGTIQPAGPSRSAPLAGMPRPSLGSAVQLAPGQVQLPLFPSGQPSGMATPPLPPPMGINPGGQPSGMAMPPQPPPNGINPMMLMSIPQATQQAMMMQPNLLPFAQLSQQQTAALSSSTPLSPPPAPQPPQTPTAVVGIDTTGDGNPNVVISGQDLNFDGIPDVLQRSPSQAPVIVAPGYSRPDVQPVVMPKQWQFSPF